MQKNAFSKAEALAIAAALIRERASILKLIADVRKAMQESDSLDAMSSKALAELEKEIPQIDLQVTAYEEAADELENLAMEHRLFAAKKGATA